MTRTSSTCSTCRRLRRVVAVLTTLALWHAISDSVSADDTVSQRRTPVVLAIQAAEPAVVNIEGNKPAKPGASSSTSDGSQVNGMGAGVIIDPRGYILTNQHVVQDVRRIDVMLHDGQQFVGRLIARDPATDLALVKIDCDKPLPVIRCGTSSGSDARQRVIAIGNRSATTTPLPKALSARCIATFRSMARRNIPT